MGRKKTVSRLFLGYVLLTLSLFPIFSIANSGEAATSAIEVNCSNTSSSKSLADIKLSAAEIKEICEQATDDVDCMEKKLLDAAKTVVEQKYENRKFGLGQCAKAVREALNKAGIWLGKGIGHAFQFIPGLKTMGFKNIFKSGMTPQDAPPGSILVYDKPDNPRGCRGAGNQYGHVEIKENDNSYLYDGNVGRSMNEAMPPRCRPLIGIMVSGDECPTCSAKVKKECGV